VATFDGFLRHLVNPVNEWPDTQTFHAEYCCEFCAIEGVGMMMNVLLFVVQLSRPMQLV